MEQFLNLLGYRAKDKITGFSGVITSLCFDLYGCIQVCITQPVDDKGQISERANAWFDTNRVDVDQTERVMEFKLDPRYTAKDTSGPCESRPY